MFRGYESILVQMAPPVALGMWRIGEVLGSNETLVAGVFATHLVTEHFKAKSADGRGARSLSAAEKPALMEFYTSKPTNEVVTLMKKLRARGIVADVEVTLGDGDDGNAGVPSLGDGDDGNAGIPLRQSMLGRELGVTQIIQTACEGDDVTHVGEKLCVVSTVSGRLIDGCEFKVVCAPCFSPQAPRRLFERFHWDVLRVAVSPPVHMDDTHVVAHMSRHTRRAINALEARYSGANRGRTGLVELREYEKLSQKRVRMCYSSTDTIRKVSATHLAVMRGVRLMRLGFTLSPDEPDVGSYQATLLDLGADEKIGVEDGLSRVAMLSAEIEHAESTIATLEDASRAFSSAVAQAFGEVRAIDMSYIERTLRLIRLDLSEDLIFLAALKPRIYKNVKT